MGTSLSEAVVIADKFVLTHKSFLSYPGHHKSSVSADNAQTRSQMASQCRFVTIEKGVFLLSWTWPPHCSLSFAKEKKDYAKVKVPLL